MDQYNLQARFARAKRPADSSPSAADSRDGSSVMPTGKTVPLSSAPSVPEQMRGGDDPYNLQARFSKAKRAQSAPPAPQDTTHITPTALTYQERQQTRAATMTPAERQRLGIEQEWYNAKDAVKTAQAEVDRVQREERAPVSSYLTGATPIAVTPYATGVQAQQERQEQDSALGQAKKTLQKAESDLAYWSMARYEDRSQRTQRALSEDPAATRQYADAKKVIADQQKLYELIGYRQQGGGGAPEDAERFTQMEEELVRDYGLAPDAVSAYVGGYGTPYSEGLSVQQIMERMDSALAERKTALKEGSDRAAGYDFDDLYSYEQRVEAQKHREEIIENTRKAADEHPVGQTIGSVFVQPLRVTDVFTISPGRGDPGDPDYIPPYNRAGVGDIVDTTRGTVAEGIKNKVGDNFWGNTLSFLYSAGMSTVDSAAAVAVMGPSSVYLMGTTAGISNARDIIDRGGTIDQAVAGGVAAGAAEIFFEKFSVDNLLKPRTVSGWRSWVKETLKQGGVEASEEMATEIANILSDAAIMGQKSEFNQSVQAYMDKENMSKEEAERRAFLDCVGQVALAGAGGFVSGSLMGGSVQGYNLHQYNQQSAEIGSGYSSMGPEVADAILREGLDSDKSTDAYKLAAKLADQQAGGKKISDKDLGKLYQANVAAIQAEGQSTAVDTDPATHTPEQQAVIREYQEATDSGILDFVERWRGLKDPSYRKKVRMDIAPVDQRTVQDIQAVIGVDVSDFTGHSLSGNALAHIERRHGAKGEADHSMADLNDIARMGYVLQHYDSVEALVDKDGDPVLSREYYNADGSRAAVVRFSKRVDGTYYVVEAVPDSATKEFRVMSAYMDKGSDGTSRELGMPQSDPQPTSKTGLNARAITSTSSISQPATDVKTAEARVAQLERQIAALDRQDVARGVEDLGMQGKSTVTAMYLEGQNAQSYVQGMRMLYEAGKAGMAMESVDSAAVGSLNEHQRKAAYDAGRIDAAANSQTLGKVGGETAKTAGLVYDDYVKQNVDSQVAKRIDELCKRLGLRARFVDHIGVGETAANGSINDTEVLIAKDAEDPALVVFGHEVGHWLERTAPEAYQAFRQFATEHRQVEIDATMELYRRAGKELSYDEVLQEFVNDDIGRIIGDPEALQAFFEANKSDRTFIQKVADALRALWQKLTGKDRQRVKTAEEALVAALRASEAQTAKGVAEAQMGQGEKYMLMGTRADGIEVYETSKEVRAMPYKNRMEQFQQLMEEEYSGRTARFEADGEILYAKFDSKDISKNIYGDKRSDKKGWKAKINTGADGGIFDLVENATYSGASPEAGKSGKAHKGVDSWAYFVKTVQIDGDVFDLVANVRRKTGGEFVYSIQLRENKTTSTSPVAVFTKGDPALKVGDADDNSVAQTVGEVNGELSLKGGAALAERTAQLEEQGRQEGWSQEQLQDEVRAAVSQVLQELADEYGAIKPGEKRAREVQVPKKTGKHEKVSQTVRTILEAGATPEAAVPTIEELTAKGEFSYGPLSDKTAIKRAEGTIQNLGWDQAQREWFNGPKKGLSGKDYTTVGWLLYNNAANTGNTQLAMDILARMVSHQREAAQAVQATRILKQMDPETQLYGVQRSVMALQEELNQRFGEDKGPKLVISQELAEQLLAATDQEGRDRVMQDIYRDIGRQMPSSFADKWNAWRYLSMLGNVRTHVRNIMGNAGFAPVVVAKDMTATAIERAVSAVSGGRLERSKAMVGLGAKGRGLLAAAWGDYAKVQDAAMGGGKYSEFQNANKYIEEGRVIFRSKPGKAVETARKANSKALDAEDMWFSKPHYACAMAQYCAAHGITEETIRSGDAKALNEARAYAIREAQKATYRDTNALSQMLGGLGRDLRRSKYGAVRGAGLLVEGVLPFRKTPANILARGLEYSPLGLVKGLSYDLYQVKKGNMTGAEAIDHISAGLTGTGLLALGMFLAAQGLLRGKGPGDDKERELAKLQGHQDYSLEIGDVSITLDWLAPEVLPLFVGANLWETAQTDGELTMSDMLSAVSNVSDPLLEMSCLQSLNDIFDSVGYASQGDTSPLVSVVVSGATSYLTQGLPTIFGQGERVLETQRESTFTSKDAFLTGDAQYFLGKVMNKLPGEFQQIPYIDAWGRAEDTGNLGERAFNNLLNPAYASQIETSPMEEELVRLYEATGENVFPSRAKKYFQVKGERRDLSAEEYVDYATRKGQTARKVAEALVEHKSYRDLEDGEKAEAVADAYKYAEQTARQAVAKDYEPDSWVTKAQTAERSYKIPVETFILLRNQCAGMESIKDKDGESIANSKGLQIMEAVYAVPGLRDSQRRYLFEALNVGKSIQHYNKALVKEKLKRMR